MSLSWLQSKILITLNASGRNAGQIRPVKVLVELEGPEPIVMPLDGTPSREWELVTRHQTVLSGRYTIREIDNGRGYSYDTGWPSSERQELVWRYMTDSTIRLSVVPGGRLGEMHDAVRLEDAACSSGVRPRLGRPARGLIIEGQGAVQIGGATWDAYRPRHYNDRSPPSFG